ncbi:hypothetical protein [Streptomyces djakartensis]|uniref:Transposase n=1 Tax=Streptomyces djakartensis TaxID=68193 RepID=A0ABQ2ZK89_9ACTN|nr:hypothetical protein GCM10010384_22940 [Streptomyces djakartensis]
MGGLKETGAPFVVPGPCGVAVRDRLKHLTTEDERVLCLIGDRLGSFASRDVKARCAAGLEHDSELWAGRERALTVESSSRWTGSATPNRTTTRHDAAAVAIGRRGLGHPIRRRTAPPPAQRSDEQGHRTAQAGSVAPGREEPRPTRHRSGCPAEHEPWQQDSLPLRSWER